MVLHQGFSQHLCARLAIGRPCSNAFAGSTAGSGQNRRPAGRNAAKGKVLLLSVKYKYQIHVCLLAAGRAHGRCEPPAGGGRGRNGAAAGPAAAGAAAAHLEAWCVHVHAHVCA